MIWLVYLLACRRPAPLPEVVAPPPPPPAPAQAGAIVEGVFHDARYPLTVPLIGGWTGEPGVEPEPLRLTASHAESGASLQAFALPIGSTEPPARPECAWNFIDTGSYRDLAVTGPVTVATCTPREPTGPRIFAVLAPRATAVIDLELSVPNETLAAGRAAGDLLLRGVRFDEVPASSAP